MISSLFAFSKNNPHACGVDDEDILAPDPVPYAGHSNQALLAHFW
jgi:hypothetical protein